MQTPTHLIEKKDGSPKKSANWNNGKGRKTYSRRRSTVKSDERWKVFVLSMQTTFAQSAGVVEYTDYTSADPPPHPTSVLDMTLNNLMVRFQWCWSFGEYGVPLHCHSSQVHIWPWVVAPDRALSMSQIELNFVLMINWIIWIRTIWLNWIHCFWQLNCVLSFKLRAYAKLNGTVFVC